MPSKTLSTPVFIDPLTDFGFKRLFGSEPNKDLLIDLLNSIFQGRKHIVDLVYNKNEHTGDNKMEGTAIFDLTCTCDQGEQIIIEVQRGKPHNFKSRAFFYTSVLAASQAPRGGSAQWGYKMPEIYLIAILEDFTIDPNSDGNSIQEIVQTNKRTGEIFYEGFGYIFLELVTFNKTEDKLETQLDKWLYVLKHMSRLDKIPLFLRKTIFEKLFNIAEYCNMTKQDKSLYNTALKRKWDNYSVMEHATTTARQSGIDEGMETGLVVGKAVGKIEGKVEGMRAQQITTAVALRKLGFDDAKIAEVLNIDVEELKKFEI